MEVVNTYARIITAVMLVNAMKDFSWMVMERLAQVSSVYKNPNVSTLLF